MPYQIQKEPAGPMWRQQVLNLVRERRQVSENATRSFKNRLPMLYDLWRGDFSKTSKDAVHLPYIYSTIWSDVARKVATSFSQWPIVSFQGTDGAVARKNEALISAQMRDAGALEKEIMTFLSGDLYGTAISQVMWDHQEEIQTRTDFKSMPLSGEVVRQLSRERIVKFDGPNYRTVDLLDAFPQPRYRTINGNQGMQWFIVRYYLDLDECRFLASDAAGQIFSRAEVEKLAFDNATVGYRLDEALIRRFETRSGIMRDSDRYTRPVEIIEMWGIIPRELAGPFGGTNVVISVANDNYIFRAEATRLHHAQKPFIKYSPTPDMHNFFAPGKAEVAAGMQLAANSFVNHMIRGSAITVHPMWLYNRNKGINTRQLYAGPGRIFGVDGDPEGSLSPVPFNAAPLAVGGQMASMLWSFIQMGTGVQEDTVMGLGGAGGGDRQTAREFMGRREASGTRLMLESVIYENTYLEPLADFFAALNRQFLEVPREVAILGQAAQTDPITGKSVSMTKVTIAGSDLMHSYVARALGSTMSVSKMARQANDREILQVLATMGPQMAGSINMVNFLRELLTNLDYKNVNEIVQEQPTVQSLLAQGGFQQAGQVPQAGDMEAMAALAGGGGPSASPIAMQ